MNALLYMQTLPHALSEGLDEESLELKSSVLSLASNQQGNPLRNNWTITYSKEGSEKEEKHFDAVILTVSCPVYLQSSVVENVARFQDTSECFTAFFRIHFPDSLIFQ